MLQPPGIWHEDKKLGNASVGVTNHNDIQEMISQSNEAVT